MHTRIAGLGLLAAVAIVSASRADTHRQVQAVDSAGYATYWKVIGGGIVSPENLIVLEGIVLNNPEDMLDSTYNAPGFMGAQWQIFVQGEGDDHGGTAIWIGQKYSKMGDVDYTEGEWADEMQRLNDLDGHTLRAGDRIRMTGYGMDHNGKVNINERHSTSPLMDFTVEWLGSTPGLPRPEVISLADVRDAADTDIFDASRLVGGEYYQGRLIRINNVHIQDGTWGPGQMLTIADDTGRTFPVELGINPVFSQPSNLATTFDIVGIMNQEDACTAGYQVWVMGYNGGSDLLGTLPILVGDINGDSYVNVGDLQQLVAAWNGGPGFAGPEDINGDGYVNVGDLQLLVAHWGE